MLDKLKEKKLIYNVLDYGITTNNIDNTEALQKLIDMVHNLGGGTIYFPNGTYLFDSEKSSYDMTDNITALCQMKSFVSILGENISKTILKVTGKTKKGAALFCYNSDFSCEILEGANAQNFTIDMSLASLEEYTHRGKAFYYSGVKDSIFRDLKLISTPSTALGIDMLDNVVIDSIYVYEGGKSWSYGGPGGAGIGIGTGKWNNENFIIRNCICEHCGYFGIFIEDQGIFHNKKNYPKGQIISNNIIRNSRHYAIGIRGGDSVLVTANNIYDNIDGIYLDYGAKNIVINNNIIKNSKDTALCFGNEDKQLNEKSISCENIVINGNTFINNNKVVIETTKPKKYIETNNIYIN